MLKIPVLQIPINGGEITQGDTIPEIIFAFGLDDEIDLTGVDIKIDLWLDNCKKVISFTSDSNITIVDTKTFKINEIPAEESAKFPSGLLKGDLEITDTEGVKTTYIEVVFKIRKQYTCT
jgi:hypothetical protein